mmetsp:Transcript_119276/g.338192  ORF Transcript_119276/g.338192 Transcript_119276/m.338192 type:complete len:257 (+) Transcript_119276:84-854(+)
MTPTLTPSAAPSTASQHDALLEPPGEPSGGPCESNVGSGRSWTTRGAAAGIGVVVFVGTVLVAVLGVTAGCSGRGCCGGVPTLECLRRSLGHAACQGWCAPGADPQPAPRVFLRPPAALPKAALAGGAPPSPLRSLALAPTNAGCFLVDAGKMLLVKHTSGFLDIPGGTGKVGEPPEATAARETFEETGHQVVATGLKTVLPHGFHIFDCRLLSPPTPQGEPDPGEVSEVIWAAVPPPAPWRFPDEYGLFLEWFPR